MYTSKNIIMRIRRQNRRKTSYLAAMTVFGFISSTSIRRGVSRAFVRAAFSTRDVGSKAAFGRVGPHSCTNSRQFINQAISSNKFSIQAREPRLGRVMSTAAADQDIDSALEELLGEALREAENPAADAKVGGRGHIEGSRPFPKDLVEEVCTCLHKSLSLLAHAVTH